MEIIKKEFKEKYGEETKIPYFRRYFEMKMEIIRIRRILVRGFYFSKEMFNKHVIKLYFLEKEYNELKSEIENFF